MARPVLDVWHHSGDASDHRVVGQQSERNKHKQKKIERTEREFNTALFMLRCVQLGISIRDLDVLTVGTVLDMMTESGNDDAKYAQLATQDDFNKF